jgi:hypothetical protein
VRRIGALAALALVLAACSGDSGREFARYYDPEGYFVTNLPAANDLTVASPQFDPDGLPVLLAGVLATPPQPSPSPSSAFTSFNAGSTGVSDQTIYRALAVPTAGFRDLDEMVLSWLTGDPAMDVIIVETVRVDADEGRLVVVDVAPEGVVISTMAWAFTLGGDRGHGFVITAIFPPGQWDAERGDFFRVLESFRSDVPPGFETFPLVGPVAG